MITCPIFDEPCRKYVEAEMIGTKVYERCVCAINDALCDTKIVEPEYVGNIRPRTAVFVSRPEQCRIIDEVDYVAERGEE